jgi:hypothetical protein
MITRYRAWPSTRAVRLLRPIDHLTFAGKFWIGYAALLILGVYLMVRAL